MSAPGDCPSADTLRAFGSGRLDDATAEAVVAHIKGCSPCRAQAASLSGDSFLARLQAVQGRRATPAPGTPAPETIDYRMPTHAASPHPHTAEPVPPELRDHPQYEVLRELGRGGMGVVYLAKNKIMGRQEVLKVVNPDLLDHPDATARFLREIRSAANLSHANIVTAYAALQVGGSLVLAMEYVEGEDLAKAVANHGPLPVANACYYVSQAALGLHHAFEKGMVHRDIKPQNLILARDGKKHTVKILDFGLAKATRAHGTAPRNVTGLDRPLTKFGTMMGTPDYIAPEQIQDAARADVRADLYSLGCTLYHLLTGQPPFPGKNLESLLEAHLTQPATPVNEIRPEVPPELAAVVARLMAKDPGQRYQKPVELAQALAPFVKVGIKPQPAGARPAGGEPAEAPGIATLTGAQAARNSRCGQLSAGRKGTLLWLVGGGGGVALLVGCAIWLGGADANEERVPAMVRDEGRAVPGKDTPPNRNVSNVGFAAPKDQAKATAEVLAEAAELRRLGQTGQKDQLKWLAARAAMRLPAWRWAAERGSAAGVYLFARCLSEGIGTPRDDAEAVKWFRKAAVQGHALCQNNLGWMYANGRGVIKDDEEAVKWYHKAAVQEDAGGQNNLGIMYENGRGAPKSDVEAVKWYRKAAAQGHAPCQNHLGWMYANGRGVIKDDEEAVKWYHKAAAQGFAVAQGELGYMHENGRGVNRDLAKAIYWYRLARAGGVQFASDALVRLGKQ